MNEDTQAYFAAVADDGNDTPTARLFKAGDDAPNAVNTKTACLVCRGAASWEIVSPDGMTSYGWQDCDACKGTGHAPDGDSVPTPTAEKWAVLLERAFALVDAAQLKAQTEQAKRLELADAVTILRAQLVIAERQRDALAADLEKGIELTRLAFKFLAIQTQYFTDVLEVARYAEGLAHHNDIEVQARRVGDETQEYLTVLHAKYTPGVES